MAQLVRSSAPPRQCQGLARSGKQCSITSRSDLRDQRTGRLAAFPLQRGAHFCAFHLQAFSLSATATPAPCQHDGSGPLIVVYIDLETTGLDVLSAEVVELGAVAEGSGAAFACLARPRECSPSQQGRSEKVHGISAEELSGAPAFEDVMNNFHVFLSGLASPMAAAATATGSRRQCMLRESGSQGDICLVAHNGIRFDFAVLVAQCFRLGLSLRHFARYLYCDSMDLLRLMQGAGGGAQSLSKHACLKLQCLNCNFLKGRSCRAHRALDDAQTLQAVLEHGATFLGTKVVDIVRKVARPMDVAAVEASLSCLIDGHAREVAQVEEDESPPLRNATALGDDELGSSQETRPDSSAQQEQATYALREVAPADSGSEPLGASVATALCRFAESRPCKEPLRGLFISSFVARETFLGGSGPESNGARALTIVPQAVVADAQHEVVGSRCAEVDPQAVAERSVGHVGASDAICVESGSGVGTCASTLLDSPDSSCRQGAPSLWNWRRLEDALRCRAEAHAGLGRGLASGVGDKPTTPIKRGRASASSSGIKLAAVGQATSAIGSGELLAAPGAGRGEIALAEGFDRSRLPPRTLAVAGADDMPTTPRKRRHSSTAAVSIEGGHPCEVSPAKTRPSTQSSSSCGGTGASAQRLEKRARQVSASLV
mmetsp:Transcript_163710/g.525046  ORF Transcript_163710/g.525046 Transcript_163710/m.525046 type:complete len:660 (-) Transcript_163710:123-2102(-)